MVDFGWGAWPRTKRGQSTTRRERRTLSDWNNDLFGGAFLEFGLLHIKRRKRKRGRKEIEEGKKCSDDNCGRRMTKGGEEVNKEG